MKMTRLECREDHRQIIAKRKSQMKITKHFSSYHVHNYEHHTHDVSGVNYTDLAAEMVHLNVKLINHPYSKMTSHKRNKIKKIKLSYQENIDKTQSE